jgi:hypothetical protein
MQKELVTPTPGIGIKKMILAMEVGHELLFPIKYRTSVRPIVSDVKLDHPSRDYKTTTKKVDNAIKVTREK